MNTSQISDEELYILSFYRASELAGGILFGKLAFHTEIDELRTPLTHHAAEEVEHGWLWNKTIKELGAIPLKVTQTYQTEYGKEFGMPTTLLEILCLTQTLEKRVVEHFTAHLSRPNTHPVIKATLQKMLDDEAGHLSWIKVKLNKYSEEHGDTEVNTLMKKLEDIDKVVYDRFKADPRFTGFLN